MMRWLPGCLLVAGLLAGCGGQTNPDVTGPTVTLTCNEGQNSARNGNIDAGVTVNGPACDKSNHDNPVTTTTAPPA